jgi:nucleoid-associated protein YgaU
MTAGDRAGAPGPDLTLIVDGANVVGSRPDGWWRDRAGAAVRLHDELAGLAERGAAGIPAARLATGEDGEAPAGRERAGPEQARPEQARPEQARPEQARPEQARPEQVGTGQAGTGQAAQPDGPQTVAVVLVLEGAAKAAAARIAARTAGDGPDRPGEPGRVQVVSAPGSGDDEIVRLARSRPGRRIVITSDRELRRRSVGAGAEVAGPSWLRARL